MENNEPRSFCSSRSRSCVISRPFTAIVPLLRRALGGSRCRMLLHSTLLPQPDSPTMARDLTRAQRKADVAHGLDLSRRGEKADGQIFFTSSSSAKKDHLLKRTCLGRPGSAVEPPDAFSVVISQSSIPEHSRKCRRRGGRVRYPPRCPVIKTVDGDIVRVDVADEGIGGIGGHFLFWRQTDFQHSWNLA